MPLQVSSGALYTGQPRPHTSSKQAHSMDVGTMQNYGKKEDKKLSAAWLWTVPDSQEVLQVALKKAKTAKHFYLLLTRLGCLQQDASDRDAFQGALAADIKFKHLCKSLEKLASQLSLAELLATIEILSRMPPKDRSIVLSIENELLWKMKGMAAAELGTILKAPAHHFSQEQRSKIRMVACSNFIDKANEVNSRKQWTAVVQQLGQLGCGGCAREQGIVAKG